MKINYKLALESLEKLEEGAMRQAMIRDDREGGHWEAEEVQDHYSNVKLALEQSEKDHKLFRIIENKKIDVHLLMKSLSPEAYDPSDDSELTKEEELIRLGYSRVSTNTFRKFVDYNGKSYRIVIEDGKANILANNLFYTQQDIYDLQIVFSKIQDELKRKVSWNE